MIDEKKLAVMKSDVNCSRAEWEDSCFMCPHWDEISETLSAALKVVRAAQELITRAELTCGYKHVPGDPLAIIQLKDLSIALAPFSEEDK